jgi:hypothetical protein
VPGNGRATWMKVKITDNNLLVFRRRTFRQKFWTWLKHQIFPYPCKCGIYAHREWPKDVVPDAIEALGSSFAKKRDEEILKALLDK